MSGVKRQRSTSQFRHWCFTQWLDAEDVSPLSDLVASFEMDLKECLGVQSYQFSLERGKESEGYHFQGYFMMPGRVTLYRILAKYKGWSKAWHVEPVRGTVSQNIEYTSKVDTHVAGPYKWNMEDAIVEEADRVVAPCSDGYFNRYVEVCFGPPKIGKSRIWNLVFEYADFTVYNVPSAAPNSKAAWIGPYAGEDVALFDDYREGDFDLNTWKKLLDKQVQMVPVSAGGKSVLWTPRIIILLSNHVPKLFLDSVFTYRISRIGFWWSLPLYKMQKCEINFDPKSFDKSLLSGK